MTDERIDLDHLSDRKCDHPRTTKAREHELGCPGVQAWDIPEACQCLNPMVVRCAVCGVRRAMLHERRAP